jgi:cell wall-associated NlpC family hydrolase
VGLAVPGLFCTLALPAYAYRPVESAAGAEETAALTVLKESRAQTVVVDEAVAASVSTRDSYTLTSAAELARVAQAAEFRAYSGPSVGDYLANPPYPSFSLDAVVQVALQYQGVPYRYGGADPSGFDCSGFTMFVYAQFGVALPHSAGAQSRMTRIAPEAALPGDIVVTDGGGHVGIYLGGNTMIDSPMPGRVVEVREIYDPGHWFVRVGI